MSSRKSSSKSKNTSSAEVSLDSDITVKLRRLKIEEHVLSKSTGRTSEDLEDETEEESGYMDSKTLFDKLKNFYIDIRDLFEELKVSTSTKDNLQSLDIEEVKNTVNSIEVKTKRFKTFLKSELKMLKHDELELTKEEVHEFQEFLSRSRNQYGGWILYNHNIFENCWQKYFNLGTDFEHIQNSQNFIQFVQEVRKKTCDTNLSQEDVVLHSIWYAKYLTLKERQQRALEKWKRKKELLKKTHGKQKLIHIDEKTSNQKLCRKNAKNIECLKNNESFPKDYLNEMFSDKFYNFNNQLNDQIVRCLSAEEKELENLIKDTIDSDVSMSGSATTFSEVQLVKLENQPKEHFSFEAKVSKKDLRKPMAYTLATEQWNHRCNDSGDLQPIYMDVENLTKRRIPEWRLGLYAKQ